MSLLQEEREIILSNEHVDNFDFAEVEDFIRNADKNLFISHHFKNKKKDACSAKRRISDI